MERDESRVKVRAVAARIADMMLEQCEDGGTFQLTITLDVRAGVPRSDFRVAVSRTLSLVATG